MNPAILRLGAKHGSSATWRHVLAAAALAVLAGCAGSSEAPLRVAISPWPGYQLLQLAQSQRYFDAAQVRLVELVNAHQVSAQLRAGTVDAATVTLDETLALMQDGVDLRVVLVMDASNGADAVLARPGITSLADLRGKRVGVETAAVGAVMLDAMLTAAGLAATDVHLVNVSVNESEAAYRDGKVDAVVTYEPARTRLLEQGAHILFDSRSIPGRIVDVLVVRADALDGHQRSLMALVAAHFNALEYLVRQPQDAARQIAPVLGVTADRVTPLYSRLKLSTLAENHALLSGSTPGLSPTAAELGALMLRQHLLQTAVSADHLVEPKFLPPVAP
ncbi:MAG TPA: ABC transporter substrate-binding protein [Gemmatimonadaceae bacterium]